MSTDHDPELVCRLVEAATVRQDDVAALHAAAALALTRLYALRCACIDDRWDIRTSAKQVELITELKVVQDSEQADHVEAFDLEGAQIGFDPFDAVNVGSRSLPASTAVTSQPSSLAATANAPCPTATSSGRPGA